MARSRALVALAVAVLAAGCARRCGGTGGTGPIPPPVITDKDGHVHHVLDKGAYKAFYDVAGRLERIEYDSNGDGKPDHIAYHDGNKTPRRIDVDSDFDGKTDRWEYYDAGGKLEKIGAARRGKGPDVWLFLGPGGEPRRKEYDEDSDGKVDRAEELEGGRVLKLELDSDHDGRIDRWQDWQGGRLQSEDLDTDHDGVADRRIRYTAKGGVAALEKLAPAPPRPSVP